MSNSIKKLLWIGSMVPEDFYKSLCQMGYKNQQASRIAQQNIIEGLKYHYGSNFDFVSGPAIPGYPKFEKLITPSLSWNVDDNHVGRSPAYLNIEYINRLFKRWAMKSATQKVASRYNDFDSIIVFMNSPHTPFISSGLMVKKKFKDVKTVLIIPDLPQYMESSASKFKQFLKSIDNASMMRKIKEIDYYVVYASAMIDYLGLPKEKCVLMEGCTSEEAQTYEKQAQNGPFTFMYSGTADFKFGLNLLVDAFRKIEGDCRLIITGKGDATEYIEEAAKVDCRIKYCGFVSDYTKVKQMQTDADVLMNMRLPSEPASKYCFPSKLFEYMKTGNPVISFKIDGIPQEYFKYMLTVENENIDTLTKMMQSAMNMKRESLMEFGCAAKKFVLESKNNINQAQIIYDLINKGI